MARDMALRDAPPSPAADDLTPARPAIIAVEGVSKLFGAAVRALDDVTLTIADNEFFTLLGPSGCGKTTLLRILAGFEYPTEGRVLLDGADLAALAPNKRPVNTMFQSYALFPHLTVARNVSFGLEMLDRPAREVRARVSSMLALVRLSELADRKPAALSGGQQQRVALARALAPHPRVLLLDEPLSALDQKLRKEMQLELKRLQRETGITFVLVTHDQEEALAMSDRIAVLRGGEVQQVGTPEDIYERPVNRFVADFIGEANVLALGALGREGAGFVVLRPERVRLASRGRLPGRLLSSTYLGSDTLHEVDAGAEKPVRVRARSAGPPPPAGSAVFLDWDDDAERVLRA